MNWLSWRYLDATILALLISSGLFSPRLVDSFLATIETGASRLASRKRLAIVAVAALTILLRLSLLPILPVPVPIIHDEFSYLLAADTFAHARLANPPHPMWMFLDTFHVLQHPTYASMYPPAQGAVLALGQLLGNPWVGVLLSTAGMCAALLWMLQGWFPPEWALLGTLLAMMQVAISSYWMNSYWGGSVAALGGALVMGAMPRIMRENRARDALILGLGAAILANSRPFEGFVLCATVAVALAWWLFSADGPSARFAMQRIVLPVTAVLLPAALFILYYNARVTGHPLLFPHALDDRLHLTVPNFIWQRLAPPLHYANPQFDAFYNDFLRDQFSGSWFDLKSIWTDRVDEFYNFFLSPALVLPLAALPWVLLDRRARFLIAQTLICALALFAVVWFTPHYAAPLFATLVAVLTLCFQRLRRWRWKAMPLGVGLTRACVLCVAIMVPICASRKLGQPFDTSCGCMRGNSARARIASQLESEPGRQLAIVRYGDGHNIHQEWVYNRADIDSSKLVWAREIPGADIRPLLDYFKDRRAWLVQLGDDDQPLIRPYVSSDWQKSAPTDAPR